MPNLVQCVGGIGDELSEEDFLLGVEGVDDDVHESAYLSLEGDAFGLGRDEVAAQEERDQEDT